MYICICVEAHLTEQARAKDFGEGQLGSALMGPLQISCFVTGTSWGLNPRIP